MEEMAGVRRIVIHRNDAVSFLACRHHLCLGGVPVPRRSFLEQRRIHKLRFGKSQAVAYFEQDPPKFREPVHVIEITVRTYILRYDPPDTIRADKRDKDGTECAVHLVAVTLSAFGKVLCSGLMHGKIPGMRSYIQCKHLFPVRGTILQSLIRHSLSQLPVYGGNLPQHYRGRQPVRYLRASSMP